MEIINTEFLTDTDRDEKKYSFQYNKLHIDTLELKIKEKDTLLLELSSINQEIYQELLGCQNMFQQIKQEKEYVMQQNTELKHLIDEKSTYISQQDAIISRLRNQLSNLTNGNSFSIEEKSTSVSRRDDFYLQLKNLQEKYDYREDLIISLQEERITLLNDIDRFRKSSELITYLAKTLNVQPDKLIEKAKLLQGSIDNSFEKL